MFKKLMGSRIALFAGIFAFILTTGLLMNCQPDPAEARIWNDSTFHQSTIDMSKYGDGIVIAKVENKWREFNVRNLPDEFIEWNAKARLETIDKIKEGQMPPLNGPHNAMIASHGRKRFDSQFSINNAVKGTGFVPKEENIEAIIKKLNATIDNPLEEKIAILEDFYLNCDSVFDRTKLVSLELYSTPEFETQSFLNQMTDPGVAIVYLDIPTYKIKAIAQLLHPDNPELTDYEKNVVEYINLIHSYFHGDFSRMFIGVIYHVVEVYDSSPRKDGRGKKI